MKTYAIDKITNGIAACECLETGETIEITPPAGAKEGDLLHPARDGAFTINHEATKDRRKNLEARLQRLFTF
ncbi:MAG: DUF3006 domain-containing protein [Defluviitaleaceae bacterium]|nr:DUF3006 domain-containing protein [Defluviitaleaceae bacterium]